MIGMSGIPGIGNSLWLGGREGRVWQHAFVRTTGEMVTRVLRVLKVVIAMVRGV